MDYEDWKKGIDEKLKNINFDNIPQIIKRCPMCHYITLEFDVKTRIIKCTKCGFEENLPMLK